MTRLSNAALATLSETATGLELPDYDRSRITPGIVHLGIGAFHRAHQAAYTDAVLAEDPGWGIIGVSLRTEAAVDALNEQDGLFCLTEMAGERPRRRIIGSVLSGLAARRSLDHLIAALAASDTRIVSLTVTEKGYCLGKGADGGFSLDFDHPDIVHDLANPDAPRSAIGTIVCALRCRRDRGLGPFTVMSCDNLPANGPLTRQLTIDYAEALDPALARWIDETTAFPATMVDRITPATTAQDREALRAETGLIDDALIVTEPFTQWVIEDRFSCGRPAWDRAGALFADDVAPFEHAKLRMLNGSHSTLAYLGYLSGHRTVADVMANPVLAGYVRNLMAEEIAPVLETPPGMDLSAYRDQLIDRFENRALKHATWQIAMDGSQKLPQRLLSTIRERLAKGLPYPRLALAIAGWIVYVSGTDEAGNAIDIRDPLKDELAAAAKSGGGDPARTVEAFLKLGQVFGDDLPENADFRQTLTATLELLVKHGAIAAVGQVEAA